MKQTLYDIEQTIEMIKSGKTLLLAGDINQLAALPEGNWIGGTIPYFIAEKGGVMTKDKIFVTVIPDYIKKTEITTYTTDSISKIFDDAPEHGLSLIIIPATSDIHLKFAVESPSFSNFATRPLAGWISGVHLDDLDTEKPAVFSGTRVEPLTDRALVLHLTLPENKYADIEILNIFKQGIGDTIQFTEDGFQAKKALINGKQMDFADYLNENKIDTRLPLVANYFGAMVNVSFQGIDENTKTVNFYAPVFKNIEYRIADTVTDYVKEFTSALPSGETGQILFSCNCILNYLYSELEGKKTAGITGPITFGEIAYQLLNQTMVYITLNDL